MCGCSPIGRAPSTTYASAAPGAPLQAAPTGPVFTGLPNPLQLPTQRSITDGSVRDPNRARQTLQRLEYATRNLQTPAQARAAGYRPNPSSPDHFINNDIFATRNGYDLDRPATVMYEHGRLVGVMLSHDPRKGPPPDLGAGAWHTHGGTSGTEYAAHVYFNKPLATSFGTESGDV